MRKTTIFIEVMRTKNGWKLSADNPRYGAVDRTGVPDNDLGNVMEGITDYVEHELGCVCDFYIV